MAFSGQQVDDFEKKPGAGPAKDPAEGKRPIPGVRNVVAVASGKGGVGKSTISANLAVAAPEAPAAKAIAKAAADSADTLALLDSLTRG